MLEAKDLIKKDIGVFKKGSSDPYVILRGTFSLLLEVLHVL